MKTKLLASANSKADLEKLVNEYFYSTNYRIDDDLTIKNVTGKTVAQSYIIKIAKNGKLQFRRIEEV